MVLRFAALSATALILQANAADDVGKPPKQSNAVNRVLKMLKELQVKVEEEGKHETKTYAKFERFCTETKEEKDAAIKEGGVKKAALEALIEKKTSRVDVLTASIAKLATEIAGLRKDVTDANAERKTERKAFDKADKEVTHAIKGLDKAVDGIRNSDKGFSFLQLPEVKGAALLADSMGLEGASDLLGAPTADYGFHSGGIVETLEKLQEDFRKSKQDAAEKEITARSTHTSAMQAKDNLIQKKIVESDDQTAEKNTAEAAKAKAVKDLAKTEETLAEDTKYLKDVTKNCDDKKDTFDERKGVRDNELAALKSALDIMVKGMKPKEAELASLSDATAATSPVSLELAKAAARSPAVLEAAEAAAEAVEASEKKASAFLQMKSIAKHTLRDDKETRAALLEFIKSQGIELRSPALMSLTSSIRVDPLKQVKDLINGMITKLKEAATEAADQRAWCADNMEKNAVKRDAAAKKINDYNTKMASEESERDVLKEDVSLLTKEIKALTDAQDAADEVRAEEKKENDYAVADATDGKKAVDDAIAVLKKFYDNPSGSFIQDQDRQTPPKAGFKNGEKNKGSQGAATGILGMMDVIKADMERTIEETGAAEEKAADAHTEFTKETTADKTAKTTSKTAKTGEITALDESIEADEASLKTEAGALKTAMKEAADLDASCNVKANYEKRIAKRDAEIQELKKALEFFNDPTKAALLR
eukprot:TRINITY_DN596_c0_g1_i1.p1 TRINITY_DN596_c0_g1~~TRINITY_DN596_c0_g1_i1.p1  ORF type:complete len:710 (-),score=280.65 TRINITY_DN596_c0_g1_i1:236-2365(-)